MVEPILAVDQVALLMVEEWLVLLVVEEWLVLVMVEEQLVLFVEVLLWLTLGRHRMLLPRQAQKTWMLIHVLENLIC